MKEKTVDRIGLTIAWVISIAIAVLLFLWLNPYIQAHAKYLKYILDK